MLIDKGAATCANMFCGLNHDDFWDVTMASVPQVSAVVSNPRKAESEAPRDVRANLRPDSIAVHSGYEFDPTTKAVAVPIYQTVAYAFDSADHGAALFNLEVDGYRYSRIVNPTSDVLERRVSALEGGVEALSQQWTGRIELRRAECD
jgi:hypothetical protein